MTRPPNSNDTDVRKGAWGADEDEKLRKYVETYGTGHWRSVGKKAGLQRCGKSCRLRWTNYLRPDIRHGSFTTEEEDLIIKLHASHGSRWSLIAAQLPGRTDNDIKNHWNTRLKKKLCDMGIDPVTHQPIADLLRDLAGTMARSGSAGNQVAKEAARRCFRDNMLNKAVRECGRPPAVPSFLSAPSSWNIEQGVENPTRSGCPYFCRYDDPVADARRLERSVDPATSAHSMSEYSSSTEESLSGHSSSPPLYMGLTHSANPPQRSPYGSESSGHGQGDAAARILPPPPTLRLPDPMTTPPGYIPDQLATCPTLQIFPPESDAFRRSPGCDEALRGMIASTSATPFQARREQYAAPANPQHQPRWYSSRPDNIIHDQTQFQSDISRFSPAQIHADDAVAFLQGGPSGITSLETFTDKLDRDGHLNNLAPIQQNMGFRTVDMNLDGVPGLSNPSGGAVGQAGAYHDILHLNNVADAPSQFANSVNLNTTSCNVVTVFAPNSGSLAGAEARGATPTALRLHEYAVIPNPRVALWDY